MLSRDLALQLRYAGVVWRPARGDTFWVPERDLDDVEFVVSDMVVEVREVGDGGQVLAFNGTTEWALDSLETESAVWLPSEHQLRELLGDRFERLERLTHPTESYAVVLTDGRRFVDLTPDDAYARAVLG